MPPASEEIVYSECATVISSIDATPNDELLRNSRLTKAGKLMTGLAVQEAYAWLETSRQNADGSLPMLYINNGGHPRSAGDRVNMLQPVFHSIIGSKHYASI